MALAEFESTTAWFNACAPPEKQTHQQSKIKGLKLSMGHLHDPIGLTTLTKLTILVEKFYNHWTSTKQGMK